MEKQDYDHYVRNPRFRTKDKEPSKQNQKEEEVQEEEEDA
tara:strand:- start:252 stop:371 length:120 start_codon:yes stop_codon:yes gene_type:complete